jgi:hypothetical protein
MRAVIYPTLALVVLVAVDGPAHPVAAYTVAECNANYNEWYDRCLRKPRTIDIEACKAQAGHYLIDCVASATDRKTNSQGPNGPTGPVHRPPTGVKPPASSGNR